MSSISGAINPGFGPHGELTHAQDCARQDSKARVAMKLAQVYYRPPYIPPPETLVSEERDQERIIEDLPAVAVPTLSILPPKNVGHGWDRLLIPPSRGKVVIDAVAHVTKLTAAVIIGPRRHRRFVDARAAVSWLLINELHMSYPQAGRILKRDHSTIHHEVRRCEAKHFAIIAAAKERPALAQILQLHQVAVALT